MGLAKYVLFACGSGPVILIAMLGWSAQLSMKLQPYKVNCWYDCPTMEILPPPADSPKPTCTPPDQLTLEDLETKGYTVIQKFLKEADCKYFYDIHKRITRGDENLPGVDDVTDLIDNSDCPRIAGMDVFQLRPSLKKRLQKVVGEIHNRTNIRLKSEGGGIAADVFFLKTDHKKAWDNQKNVNYGWHQDLEPWWLFQEVYHYLNFYIVLAKEHPKKAGLSVVPFDTLRERSPQLYEHVVNKGASEYSYLGKRRMQYLDKSDDRQYTLPFTLDALECTPDLSPGDVLILRGDAIHRTQPHKSWRVTLSVRMHPHQPIISSEKLLEGGRIKYQRMAAATDLFKKRLQCSMQEEGEEPERIEPAIKKIVKRIKEDAWNLELATFGKLAVDYASEFGLIDWNRSAR